METKADLDTQVLEIINNELVLEPELPAFKLAERAIEHAEPELIADLGRVLLLAHFTRLVRIERGKQARERRKQMLLPGFEHLPLTLRLRNGKRVPLRMATYSDVRAYYRKLSTKYDSRRRDDPKLSEAKRLLERMRRQNAKHRGVHVAEALNLSLDFE